MSKFLQITFLFLLCSLTSSAQDLIVKTNGESIQARVTEVGVSTVTYKKASMPNGPVFTDNKSDISYIKYESGEVQKFSTAKIDGSKESKSEKVEENNEEEKKEESNTKEEESKSNDKAKIKIEVVGKGYTIDGKKATRKEVDKQLAKSKNPAILVPLKVMKTTGIFQKSAKITSIPTTIVGIPASLVTLVDLINDARRHRDNTKTYVGVFGSVLGTMALPITNKILTNKNNKMREKLIDLYNVTN